MKKLPILASAAIAVAAIPLALSTPASAAPMAQHGRHHVKWRTVCTTKWVHHHKVRSCHKVRVWR